MDSNRRFASVLFLLDTVGLVLAYGLAYKLRFSIWFSAGQLPALTLMVGTALFSLFVMDAYRVGRRREPWDFTVDCSAAIFVAMVASIVVTYLVGVGNFSPVFGRGIFPVAMTIFAVWGLVTRWKLSSIHYARTGTRRWLLIGPESVAQSLVADYESSRHDIDLERLPDSCSVEQIRSWINSEDATPGVIIYHSAALDPAVLEQIGELKRKGVEVLLVGQYYERYRKKVAVAGTEEQFSEFGWTTRLTDNPVESRVKRLVDFLLGLTGLVLTLPLIFIVAVVVRFSSRGPVIYRQERVGQNGQPFVLYKFRSMVENAESDGAKWTDKNDPRITSTGRFLRASRLDELPQLWNLVLGDMSLIGPRPERPEFVESLVKEIPYYHIRERVAPGITGWAQVMYPYGASVYDAQRKLEYDLYYIKNRSLRLDLAIILKTVLVVIKGLGR